LQIEKGEARDGYFFAKARGENNLASVRETLAAIRARADAAGLRRILIDGREVDDDERFVDRYEAGLAFAATFPTPYRVAVLRRREHITKLGENTAVNRGADFLVCEGEDVALAWLLRS